MLDKLSFVCVRRQKHRPRRIAADINGHRLNLGTATIDVGSDSARAMFLATDANEGQFIQHLYFTKEK